MSHTNKARQIRGTTFAEQQIDEMKSAMRDALAITMGDLQHDVDRIQQKQETLTNFFQKFLGVDRDGRVMQPFSGKSIVVMIAVNENVSEKFPSRPFDGEHVTYRPNGQAAEDIVASQFNQMELMWAKRQSDNERFMRSELMASSLMGGNRLKSKTSTARRNDPSDSGEQEYTFGTNGTQGKRIVNGIVKPVDSEFSEKSGRMITFRYRTVLSVYHP